MISFELLLKTSNTTVYIDSTSNKVAVCDKSDNSRIIMSQDLFKQFVALTNMHIHEHGCNPLHYEVMRSELFNLGYNTSVASNGEKVLVTLTDMTGSHVFKQKTLLLLEEALIEVGVERYYYDEEYLLEGQQLWTKLNDYIEQTKINSDDSEITQSLEAAHELRSAIPGGQILRIQSEDFRPLEFLPSLNIKPCMSMYIYTIGNRVLLPNHSSDYQHLWGLEGSQFPVLGFCKNYNVSITLIASTTKSVDVMPKEN